MPAIDFKADFVPQIVNGNKYMTTRKRGKRLINVGDKLVFFHGRRVLKPAIKFGEAVCDFAANIIIDNGNHFIRPKRVAKVFNVPKGVISIRENTPFTANKNAENGMLLSALRRLQIRGHFEEIYERLN